jgi:hypothetical protein
LLQVGKLKELDEFDATINFSSIDNFGFCINCNGISIYLY